MSEKVKNGEIENGEIIMHFYELDFLLLKDVKNLDVIGRFSKNHVRSQFFATFKGVMCALFE